MSFDPATGSSDKAAARHVCPVDVFVRIRASLSSEDQQADPLQSFIVTGANGADSAAAASASAASAACRVSLSVSSSIPSGAAASAAAATKPKLYRGLAGVFSPSQNTAAVYTAAVEPLVRGVLRGETGCVFAYGHTGSGKTHSVVGYGAELGLYRHCVSALTASIADLPQLELQVRCAELYQGKVYDLLADRAECQLREDADGQVHIRGATVMDEQGRVRVHSLRAAYARAVDDVVSLVQRALASRAVGNSPVHAQSSRSHALIELQLVTREVRAARESLLEAEAELVPVGKARDTKFIEIQSKIYTQDPKGGYKVDQSRVSAAEQAELDQLQAKVVVLEQSVRAAREQEQAAVNAAAKILRRATADGGAAASSSSASASSLSVSDASRPRECGTLVLVDLAGAEYAALDAKPASASASRGAGAGGAARRSSVELAEGREINSSLLSLKECLRALARGSSHVPFRNSKLTQLLRRYMQADPAHAVMLATVAPAESQAKATANTMQYAAMLADTAQAVGNKV